MQLGHALTGREADSSASLPAFWRTQPDPAPAEALRGTWFDEAIDFRDPEGAALTGEVVALTAAVEKRHRKRREADERNHWAAVRRILANGLRCHYFRQPSAVAYSRKADGYGRGPVWLSGEAMARTIDHLLAAGLVHASLGQWGRVSSTYAVTEKLCEIALAGGVTEDKLTVRLPFQRLVRLREGNSETPEIRYAQTPDTRRWRGLLWGFNRFLAQQDIELRLTAEEAAEWVRHSNEDRKPGSVKVCRPELIQTDLYRIFNNGSFGQGGRLYGGWWIDTPKALRPKITINGQPTVELDFSGCAIRMLYHERGLDYRDDPYRLEAIAAFEEEAGLASGHFRDAIKVMTQALINASKGSRPELVDLPNGLSFYPRFARREVRRMIEEKHSDIADTFGTGVGVFLQRRESDLSLSIITRLMEAGIVTLPIHDSFVVGIDKRLVVRAWMTKSYKDEFGFWPIVKG